MSYIQGEDRGQAALLPAMIEDYVLDDSKFRAAASVKGVLGRLEIAAAKARLDRESLTVVALPDIRMERQPLACEAEGITACAPANRNNKGHDLMFDRSFSSIGRTPTLTRALQAASSLESS